MPRTLGEMLARLRRARGLNQRTVASEMKISQGLLSHYENDSREPGLSFLRKACYYYGVSADYLLGLTNKENDAELGQRLREIAAQLREMAEQIEAVAEEVEK